MFNILFSYSIIFLIVVLDQVSKWLAVLNLQSGVSYNFIPGLLSFRYHENRGAAWGMLADQRWIFMLISTIAILGILIYIFWTRKEKQSVLFLLSLSMFAGGGIGNMIDRIYQGYVVDFLEFDFMEFPIFNIADSFITIAACLMVLELIIEQVREYKRKKQQNT